MFLRTKAITLRQALQAVHQPRATVVLVVDREHDVHAARDKGIDSTECYVTHADLIGAGAPPCHRRHGRRAHRARYLEPPCSLAADTVRSRGIRSSSSVMVIVGGQLRCRMTHDGSTRTIVNQEQRSRFRPIAR